MSTRKDQKAILQKLGISALNTMQEAAIQAIQSEHEVVLLSPTGTGKTLAFLLPILKNLNEHERRIQALILVPSRELAIQIHSVFREMGSGYKSNAVYGGQSGFKDKHNLRTPPAVLIGTPGRIADHLRRENLDPRGIKTLVLDEFDKSLEVGFEKEMKEILKFLPNIKNKILTSATEKLAIPDFIGLKNPKRLEFNNSVSQQLSLVRIDTIGTQKTQALINLLRNIGKGNGIIFCNLKDSIQTLSQQLKKSGIRHACFYGGLEQRDRETSLIKFRNGSVRILLATDLAARGIDVPDLDFIIHFEIPQRKDEFVHRNGRTARMQKHGTAYLIKTSTEALPAFASDAALMEFDDSYKEIASPWITLYISGGRKDKISKGDIAGLFFKQGKLKGDELGRIELKQDCAYVAVPIKKAKKIVSILNNSRLKKKKVRISILQ